MKRAVSKNKVKRQLTFVLGYCSCCHMIHIPVHHKLFHSRRRIPKAKEIRGNKLNERQTRTRQVSYIYMNAYRVISLMMHHNVKKSSN